MQALVDGPENLTGVRRQLINFKWIALTDMKVNVGRNARQKKLTTEWKAAKVQDLWAASSWGKKLAAQIAKAGQTDFGRFQAKIARQKRSTAIKAKLGKA